MISNSQAPRLITGCCILCDRSSKTDLSKPLYSACWDLLIAVNQHSLSYSRSLSFLPVHAQICHLENSHMATELLRLTPRSQRRFFCGMLGSMDLLASLNIVSDSINKMHSPLPLASHTQDTHTVHTLEKVRLLGETKLRHEITEDIYVQSSNLVIIKPMNFPSTCWHI